MSQHYVRLLIHIILIPQFIRYISYLQRRIEAQKDKVSNPSTLSHRVSRLGFKPRYTRVHILSTVRCFFSLILCNVFSIKSISHTVVFKRITSKSCIIFCPVERTKFTLLCLYSQICRLPNFLLACFLHFSFFVLALVLSPLLSQALFAWLDVASHSFSVYGSSHESDQTEPRTSQSKSATSWKRTNSPDCGRCLI